MEFVNTSFFLIPVWFDDFAAFTSALKTSGRWIPVQEKRPSYLLAYVERLSENPEEFQSFWLNSLPQTPIYMYEDYVALPRTPELTGIRFSCFGTGVGFLEFRVRYQDLTPEQITNFSYRFKKASPVRVPDGKRNLYDTALSLMPPKTEATLFFTGTAAFKRECLCYHMLYLDAWTYNPNQLIRLRRSYSTDFTPPHTDSDYDMVYEPYAHEHWGGSQEGLAAIITPTGDPRTDRFYQTFKYEHLTIDYHFLYLLLLNQRYSAIAYISRIAQCKTQAEAEKLSLRIATLRTGYSFNVISDDLLFQNIYTKLYKILDIHRLLQDLQEGETQTALLRSSESARREKWLANLLAALSGLTLFSALIDAASFFDRFPVLEAISTWLSIGATAFIVAALLLLFRKK